MILLIDTTSKLQGKQIAQELLSKSPEKDCEYVNAYSMNISHCMGCNFCWLKTPGECVIKDDYEPLLKKISKADQVWLISETKRGFVSYAAKNIVDRVLPIVIINMHFPGRQMRHYMRYDKNPDWGLICFGEADRKYLSEWIEKVASNLSGKSLGAYDGSMLREVISCML